MSPTAESIKQAGKVIVGPIITVAVIVVVLLIGVLIVYDIGTDNADQVLDCAAGKDGQGALVFTAERHDFDEFNNGTITLRVGDCRRLDDETLTATLDALVGLGTGGEPEAEEGPDAEEKPDDTSKEDSNDDQEASQDEG